MRRKMTIVLMICAFAAGFLVRAKVWPDRILTLSEYRKKPYSEKRVGGESSKLCFHTGVTTDVKLA
jgi:hypothetical protein